MMARNKRDRIPVELKIITDPDGESRLGAVVLLEEVLSTPDIKERLSTVESDYDMLLKQCEGVVTAMRSPEGKANAQLRWKLADMIYHFLRYQTERGIFLMNSREALARDLCISMSALGYILRFREEYKSLGEIDEKINWSKYQELLDVPTASRKKCERLIKDGIITNDSQIREFKKRTKNPIT